MRKLLAFTVAVAAAAAIFLTPAAQAGPVFKVALVSLDAGSTNTVQLQAKSCYCVQPQWSETCIAFGKYDGGTNTNGLAADCTKDFIVPQSQGFNTTRLWPFYCFDSAGRTALVARNLDGGASNVNLYTLEVNPVSPSGCTTAGMQGGGF